MASQVPQKSLGTGAGSDKRDNAPSRSTGTGTYLTPGSEGDSEDDSYSIIAASENDTELQHRDVENRTQFEDEEEDEEDGVPLRGRGRKGSASTIQSFMLYTPDEERAVIRKFDRRLVSLVSLLYMLSFLDRSSWSPPSSAPPPAAH